MSEREREGGVGRMARRMGGSRTTGQFKPRTEGETDRA